MKKARKNWSDRRVQDWRDAGPEEFQSKDKFWSLPLLNICNAKVPISCSFTKTLKAFSIWQNITYLTMIYHLLLLNFFTLGSCLNRTSDISPDWIGGDILCNHHNWLHCVQAENAGDECPVDDWDCILRLPTNHQCSNLCMAKVGC